jgi:glycine/D-amino acid oxidase-like deaminating enzyme
MRVAIIDIEPSPMVRASLVNQARVHNGYHYPRSIFTALKSTSYYDRFLTDFPEAINGSFRKIYAIAAAGSFTDARAFAAFCARTGIPATYLDPESLFNAGAVEAAYATVEHAFDAPRLRDLLLKQVESEGGVDFFMPDTILHAAVEGDRWALRLASERRLTAGAAVNATYAGCNQVLQRFGQAPIPLKYELCEIILAKPTPELADVGITVMDGPFFSTMPFGHSGLHTLTAVDYTPRRVSTEALPSFSCQAHHATCRPELLDNCSRCPVRPVSSWPAMRQLAARFLRSDFGLSYEESAFAVKTVLRTAEVDDSRPTLIHRAKGVPELITVLSGKINTLYDLEDAL